MKSRKAVSLAAAITAAALAVASCSSSNTDSSSGSQKGSKKGTVSFSPMSARIPLLQGMSTVIGKLVGKDGYKYSVIDGELDATKQVQGVTQAIENGTAKAVWLIPVAAQAMTPVIQQAK